MHRKYINTTKTDKLKFYSCIKKLKNGCWKWTGTVYKGRAKISLPGVGTTNAARFSHYLKHGELSDIPNRFHIIHYCDNPLCVNPEHLGVETPYNNSLDSVQKGISLFGMRNPNAKLTEDDVENIRLTQFQDALFSIKETAALYNVCCGTIYNIINWITWRHFNDYHLCKHRLSTRISPDEFHSRPKEIEKGSLKADILDLYRNIRPNAAKIEEEDVKTITRLRNRGNTYPRIQKLYPELTVSELRSIAVGDRWKNVVRIFAEKKTYDMQPRFGESAPNCKLSTIKVKKIKRLYADGRKITNINKLFPEVTYSNIYSIVKNRSWVNV